VGADNPKGLRLRFFETDEGVEVDYVSPPHLDGAPGIIHGGIQGTLLDEAMCMAVYAKRGVASSRRADGPLPEARAERHAARRPQPDSARTAARTFVIEGGIHLAESARS
jgi:hypothetical protein